MDHTGLNNNNNNRYLKCIIWEAQAIQCVHVGLAYLLRTAHELHLYNHNGLFHGFFIYKTEN